MKIALQDVAAAIGSEPVDSGGAVAGWSVDSRTLAAGDLFFALRGPRHDGHCWVADAFARGAAAAVVDRPVEAPGPLLRAPDTLDALQSLARWARRRWGGEVVAVTGSAGKTTTKDVVASLLSTAMEVGKSEGNLNNHIGVPLSVLRLPDTCRAAVLEMGMNHAGELRRLAAVAEPGIGVVTNAGFAHVEYFNSAEEVALAKRELIESLPASGTAVLNADDPLVSRFREVHPGPVITFGFCEAADVRAQDVEHTDAGSRFRVGDTVFDSPLAGRHGVLNVLAGLAVARIFGIPAQRLREAVGRLSAPRMRGQRFVHNGILIFDDCYNSNPEALRAMLEVLRAAPARRRIAVLGEMLELGRWSESLHRAAGRDAAGSGVDVLVGIRGAARLMVEQARADGMPDGAACFFEDPAEAGSAVRGLAREGDAVLFKGSRGTRVEKALEAFLA